MQPGGWANPGGRLLPAVRQCIGRRVDEAQGDATERQKVREEQQLNVVKVVDRWAFVWGDPGDGGVSIDSKCKVDVLWQGGDEAAPVGETVDKYGEEVNFEARGLPRRWAR